MSVGGEDLALGKHILGVHRRKILRDVLSKDTLRKFDVSKHRKNISYSILNCYQTL